MADLPSYEFIIANQLLVYLALGCNYAVLFVELLDVTREACCRRSGMMVQNNVNRIAVCLMGACNMVVCSVGAVHHPICPAPHYRRLITAAWVWLSLSYLMALVVMSLDRVMSVRRHLLPQGGNGSDSMKVTTVGILLIVAGVFLYATTISAVVIMAPSDDDTRGTPCVIHLDDRLQIYAYV